MIKKIFYLIVFSFLTLNCYSQSKESDIKLIRSFYKDVYNKNIHSEKIVKDYVEASEAGFAIAVEAVDMLRSDTEFYNIGKELKSGNCLLKSYQDFNDTERGKFKSIDDSLKNGIYKAEVVHEKPSYLFVRNNKIVSFIALRKGENSGCYFLYFTEKF